MAANYNNSAWFYDPLSRIVYGTSLIDAQVFLLHHIKPNQRILIIGGGTGWILEEITKIYTSGLEITYAEVAPKMIARSQKRQTGDNQVIFINDAIENVRLKDVFDVVITPFLFDNFTTPTLEKVFDHLHPLLKPGGLWLNCDFQISGRWWQAVLLKSMFLFFKIVCDIEASRLPDIGSQFKKRRYKTIARQTFFKGFIVSEVFEAGQGVEKL